MHISKVVWSESAELQFLNALAFITQDSVQGAESLQNKLSLKLEAVAKHPEGCPPDKYKTNNNGSFRAFELLNYRVSYRISKGEIRILRVRHSSMKPKRY